MCLPAAVLLPMVAATAMSVGGGIISRNEANSNAEAQARARNAVLADSIQRQHGFARDAGAVFDKRMDAFGAPAQKENLAEAQTARTDDVAGNISAPPAAAGAIPLAGSAPTVVRGEIAKRMLSAFNASTDKAKALGKLGGYSDNWLGNNIGVADASRQVGTINNFSRGEAAILPGMQDAAQIGATQQPSVWGPLLTAGGNFLAMGAGKGWNPFGAAPTGPVPGSMPLGQGGIGHA